MRAIARNTATKEGDILMNERYIDLLPKPKDKEKEKKEPQTADGIINNIKRKLGKLQKGG